VIRLLIEHTLYAKINKVETAIDRLKSFEPEEGYYLAFSGGKDSICIYQLALMACVKFDSHFNFTTIDPPEVVKFIRDEYPKVSIDRPKISMWELIVKNKMPPTRMARYCCRELKERGGEGRFVITGVRASESIRRKNRKMVDMCYTKHKRIINPIIDWTDKDVWEFIKTNSFKYPSLYDDGQKRIGCIMCPMLGAKGMLADAKRYPKFYKAYMLAFEKMLKAITNNYAKTKWTSAQDVMSWWLNGGIGKKPQEENLFDTKLDRFHYE
jgi:phosphoadenosine phosphosulfate reductase